MWIYGKDDFCFKRDLNPFNNVAKKYEKEGDEFVEHNKTSHAVSKYEKACNISSITRNYEYLERCSEKLKKARSKSNRDFFIGLFLGTVIAALFYLFGSAKVSLEYPSCLDAMADEVKKTTALIIFSKTLDIIWNFISPFMLSIAVLTKFVRNRIQIKFMRIFSAFILPLIYTGFMTFLYTKVPESNSKRVLAIGFIALFAAIIILLKVKLPYQKSLIKNDKNNDTEESEESSYEDDNKDETDAVDNEVSPKSRTVTLVLSILLGYIGIHNFYTGNKLKGIIQFVVFFIASLFTSGVKGKAESAKPVIGGILMTAVCIWVFVEFILICTGKFKDKNGATIKRW